MRRRAVLAVLFSACSHAPERKEAPPAPPVTQAPRPEARPALDEEMQVAGTLGMLDDEQVAGPFQRRWDDITRCYADERDKLWYLGGRIELKVRISRTGDPKSVHVSGSTIGSYDVERCILAIARELHFSKPRGGSEAEFTYPIEFRGKAQVAAWDEGRITPHLRKPRALKDVSECKHKSSTSGLPSALMLTVYVAPGGKITSAGLHADAPLDDAFASCLVGKSKAWRVDDPLGKIAKCTVGLRY